MVLTWNYFVTPYLTKYPDICNLFNLYIEQNGNLTQQQLEDFVLSYQTRVNNEMQSLQTRMDDYNRQMVIYREQSRLYKEEKQALSLPSKGSPNSFS